MTFFKIFKIIFKLLLVSLLILFSIILIRTFSIPVFQPRPFNKIFDIVHSEAYPNAISNLSKAIQIATISDPNFYNEQSFADFENFIDTTYPSIKGRLEKINFNKHHLLYKWQGTDNSLPAVILMAHYDVVPVDKKDEHKWQAGPFSGKVDNEYIWGRGTLDNKSNTIAIFEAINFLLNANFSPKRTIYIALGADEEIGGMHGNALIAKYLIDKHTQVSFVFDEGAPIVQNLLPKIPHSLALIGVAEKGYLTVALKATGKGGHSSIPANDNPITRVNNVIYDLQHKPFPSEWNDSLTDTIDYLAPYLPFSYRLIVANLWLTRPLVMYELAKNPMTKALMTTTIAPTMFNSGIKENIVPTSAEAIVNFRLTLGDSIAHVLGYLRSIANSYQVEVQPTGDINHNPVPNANLNSLEFKVVSEVTQAVFPGVVIIPCLEIAATDSRFYAPLTRNIFRFSPWLVKREEIESVHGYNERISKNAFLKTIDFYKLIIFMINRA